jgi:hypothetical protein
LPIATTAPISPGAWCGIRRGRTGAAAASEVGAGTLFSSGLIAGGSLCGILYAVLVGTGNIAMPQAIGNLVPFLHEGTAGYIASALLFLALAAVLARSAQKKVM